MKLIAPPYGIACPHCDQQLLMLDRRHTTETPMRVACTYCKRAWNVTTPTIAADAIDYPTEDVHAKCG